MHLYSTNRIQYNIRRMDGINRFGHQIQNIHMNLPNFNRNKNASMDIDLHFKINKIKVYRVFQTHKIICKFVKLKIQCLNNVKWTENVRKAFIDSYLNSNVALRIYVVCIKYKSQRLEVSDLSKNISSLLYTSD